MLSHMMFASGPIDAWLELFGRLHPALVHFPIALTVVAAVVEMWRVVRREQGPSPFALTAMWFAAIVAVWTATSGWMNAEYEAKDPTFTLFLHRWIGISCASMMLLLAISGSVIRARPSIRYLGAWRLGVLATAAGVALVGHLGGSMVYGEGYLTDALWNALDQTEKAQRESALRDARAGLGIVDDVPSDAPANTGSGNSRSEREGAPLGAALGAALGAPQSGGGEQRVVTINFTKQVLPILQAHCYECHGNGKHKGGVRLDDFERTTTERKGEWVVKPNDPSASLMIRNIELPADDDNAMPPEGDRVPAAEIEILRKWIEEGATSASVGGSTAASGAVSDSGWSIPQRLLSTDELARIRATTPALAALGVRVSPIAQRSSNFEADASLALPPIGDAQLAMFSPLAEYLVALNLAHSAISDLVGGAIAQLRSLRTIRLDHTAASDGVAAHLAQMPHLASINFVGTPLTDAGLSALEGLQSLRKLYVWSSRITDEGVARFRSARPDVQLIDGHE